LHVWGLMVLQGSLLCFFSASLLIYAMFWFPLSKKRRWCLFFLRSNHSYAISSIFWNMNNSCSHLVALFSFYSKICHHVYIYIYILKPVINVVIAMITHVVLATFHVLCAIFNDFFLFLMESPLTFFSYMECLLATTTTHLMLKRCMQFMWRTSSNDAVRWCSSCCWQVKTYSLWLGMYFLLIRSVIACMCL